MAHMQKFKGSSAAHIIGHCEREKGKEGYLKYNNNSYIDEEKTPLNYAYQTGGRMKLKERLDEVAPKRRKDAVTMVDWIVTLPEQLKDIDDLDQKKFFDLSEAFLENRYGKENVVCSYVHLDETTPHLHFCFVPVVTDKKSGKEKLCCKELMTRGELNKFHKELDKQMEAEFNIPGLILTGVTKEAGGNQSISQLKAKTLARSVEKVKNDLEDFQYSLNAKIDNYRHSNLFIFLNDIKRGRSVRDALTDPAYYYYFGDIKAKRNGLLIPDKLLEKYFTALPFIAAQDLLGKEWNKFMDEMNTYAEFEPLEKYQEIKKLHQEAAKAKSDALNMKEKYENLYNSQLELNDAYKLLQTKRYELSKENNELYSDNRKLKFENSMLQQDVNDYKRLLDKAEVREIYYKENYGSVTQEQANQFKQELDEKERVQYEKARNQQQSKSKLKQIHRQKGYDLEL